LVISSKISGSNGVTFAYSWPQESVIRLDNTANDYTGGTFICGGTLIYGATNVLPVNGGVTITGNGVLSLGNYNATVGSISVLDGSMMSTGGVLTAGAYTLTRGTLDVPISGAGTLTKASDGTLTITNNVSLFSGSVVVQEGKLIVNTDMTSSNVTVQSGGILGGTGAVVNVTVEDGGTWSPGNSPGTQIAASALWEGGGTYLWEINDATESKKGVNPGYDWLDITGELEITASAENQFNIDITSLLPSTNNPGDADNFNSLNDYMWTIASVGGGITWSGDRDIFKLIDNFTNAGATLNKFFINFEGSNLKMAYSASGTDPWGAGDVPEPSTLLLLLPLLGKIAFRIIKTKRKDQ
jgi:autotransporter-associated beta strand protein